MFHFSILGVTARMLVSCLAALAVLGSTVGCYSYRPSTTLAAGETGRIDSVGTHLQHGFLPTAAR